MTCHTCQQGVEVIVDNLYGRRSFRCGCGVISRREPPPPPERTNLTNGFMLKGTFFGTCRNPVCRQEFEAKWVRSTCLRTECLEWVKVGRHEKPKAVRLVPQQVTRTCRLCHEEFQTWRRTTCLKRECVNRLARERRKGAAPTTITCEICSAQRVVVVRGRPPRTCKGACRTEFKRRYFATRYLNERKAS